MLRLFHVSEEPDIASFEPRPAGAWDARVTGAAVWAIDEEHLPCYLLPRDCPRVTYACSWATTEADRQRFFGFSRARRIIALEPGWIERAVSSVLYVYEMPAASFACIDPHAGHYVSREPIVPRNVTRLANPLAEMLKHDVEVRIVRNILELHEAVAQSTLSFSSTRLRNAAA